MKLIYFFVLSLLIVSCGRSQEKLPTLVLHPHEEMPGNIDKKSYKSVFLAGTIDMGSGVDWQKDVSVFFEKTVVEVVIPVRVSELVNAGEASYPFGDAEPFFEFRFNDSIDLASPAGLLDGEFAAFSAMRLICLPFCPVFL